MSTLRTALRDYLSLQRGLGYTYVPCLSGSLPIMLSGESIGHCRAFHR